MITRIEISGFKTFTDFAVDLAPLSVIAGGNASGKSNFLDALDVIKGLAIGKTLGEAYGRVGSAASLFTQYGAGEQAERMSFAIEVLIPKFEEDGKQTAKANANRLRYELELINDIKDREHFLITSENLRAIGGNQDQWAANFFTPTERKMYIRQPSYPGGDIMGRALNITVDQLAMHTNSVSGARHDISWLSNQTNGQYPAANALKSYFENQHIVDLNAHDNFSNFDAPRKNGNLIINDLKQIARSYPEALSLLGSRVSSIAKEIREIKVDVDKFDRVSVVGINRDGASFISSSLSQGTLRTIALCTLLHSKQPQRTILLEEPENGIDPRVLRKFIDILTDIVMYPEDPTAPLVQVICTTHSPIVLDLIVANENPRRVRAYLATIYRKIRKQDGSSSRVSATMISPIVPNIDEPVSESRLDRVTLGEAKRYIGFQANKVAADV